MQRHHLYVLYALVLVVVATVGRVPNAAAHGIYGHIHVTGWAIESLEDGPLADFFEEPEVFQAALFGAAFTDSGYFIQGSDNQAARAYAEHTHWEPFVNDFIALVRDEGGPPFDTLEERMRVGFLMGCAAHGLQDEIFDSLFLYQVDEHDGAGQSEADPGTDGFLALDGYIRWQPSAFVPMETVLALYAGLSEGVEQADVERGVDALTSSYLSPLFGIPLAESFGRTYRDQIPWAAEHYLDPEVPGSLISEVYPTARYLEAVWQRLHGEFESDDVVTYTFPEPPRRLRDVVAGHPDSWITILFGAGVRNGSSSAGLVDESLFEVPFRQLDTRWGGAGWSRLTRVQPLSDLEPGRWYEANFAPQLDGDSAEVIDATAFPDDFVFRFQAACEESGADCPDIGPVPVPDIVPPHVLEPSLEPAPDMGSDLATEDTSPGDTEDESTPDTTEDVGLDTTVDAGREDLANDAYDGEDEEETGPTTVSATRDDETSCAAAGPRGSWTNPVLWPLALALALGSRRRRRAGIRRIVR